MSYRATPAFAIGELELEPSTDVAAKILAGLQIRTERDRSILLEIAMKRGQRFAISPAKMETAYDENTFSYRVTVNQQFYPLRPGEDPPPGWDVIG
jgi:hypothetical protein